MSKPRQLEMHLGAMVTTVVTRTPDGVLVRPGKVQVTGGVKDAAAALGVSHDVIYELIAEGHIVAFKPNPVKNGKYRVLMSSVYAHKERQIEAAKRM